MVIGRMGVGTTGRRINGNVRRPKGSLDHWAVGPIVVEPTVVGPLGRQATGCRTNGPLNQ